ncbi:50S ribosomal protein L4 [Candidatus Campbellbacteria bacterium]|nr:MAG: 50S ribosomal protein L4 [Candidatus Campbellbacteria bacterium]
MKIKVYDIKGKEKEEISLPKEIFGLELNNDLVHQTAVSMMSNQRQVIASTKGRGEVSGGGKKPWKQKGTGRARHGSSRSPIWRGGGITFGPTNQRNFDKKINKKAKTKALFQVLSQKLKNNQIIFVDQISFDAPKTKQAVEMLKDLSKIKGFEDILTKSKNSALITNTELNPNNLKSFANLKNVATDELRKLNILDLLKYKYLIISNPKETLEILESKLNK